ncbi:MAG: acyl-CoA thioesterase domain-containing protein, partial [Acidimicrobiales bacterium]
MSGRAGSGSPADRSAPAGGPGKGGGDAAGLADRLALEAAGPDRFVSRHPTERPRVFGGLFLGQAARAAQATVDGHRPVRAVHASFLTAGVAGAPVHYTV